MRKVVVLVLAILIVPVARAAVLPIDFNARTGGARVVAQGGPVGVAAQASPAYRGDWTADTRNTWRDSDNEPRVQFNLRTGAGDNRWGFGVRLRELAGFPSAAFSTVASDVQFSWIKEAGTFRFSGSFDNGRGSGTYTFTHDQTFVNNMASMGYRNLSAEDIVHMAVIDVTVAHVRGLAQAGYANLPIEDVVRTRIHRVTPEFVRELAALGHKGLPIEDLIKFSIHRVTPDFIRGMEQRGYKNIAAEDLVKMRIHKVSPEEMDQLKALGFGGMSIDELVRFRIHKVTPEFIRSIRDAGFQNISEDQLVKFRIHKIDAQFIRHAREDGFALQTPADAVDLAIHGPRWRRRGF